MTATDVAAGAPIAARQGDVPVAPQTRQQTRFLAAAGSLALAAAVAFAFLAATRSTAVPVGAVEMATVRPEIRGPGTVQSRFPVSVGSRVAGVLERLVVDVGDEVVKGQLIAVLDRTELQARALSARRATAAAEQEVALAKANVERARSELELARVTFDRNGKLGSNGYVSQAQVDVARTAAATAQANERGAHVTVGARRAELARASQDQRVAETILSYTNVVSPMSGLVTRRALEAGSTVAPGVTIFQIVDTRALWVATLIDQTLAGGVHVGQPALIQLRSGAEASGHVVRIALEADPVTRELEIDVAFDARPPRFAINEEADVTIYGDEIRARTVPLTAVTRTSGRDTIFVVDSGRARKRPVRLGAASTKQAVILDGLAEGERIVLDPRGLKDGARVMPKEG